MFFFFCSRFVSYKIVRGVNSVILPPALVAFFCVCVSFHLYDTTWSKHAHSLRVIRFSGEVVHFFSKYCWGCKMGEGLQGMLLNEWTPVTYCKFKCNGGADARQADEGEASTPSLGSQMIEAKIKTPAFTFSCRNARHLYNNNLQ